MRIRVSWAIPWTTIAAVTVALLALAEAGNGQAPASRRATILESLLAYPVFYNGQPVRVRGVIASSRAGVELVARGQRILLLGAVPSSTGRDEMVEVTGTFLDVGRFSPDDPRLQRLDLPAFVRQRLNRDWPGAGELLALVVDAVEPAEAFPAPSVRALALSPERYVGASVTVTGRFRGRNLYGDLPKAPGVSRWDFVLQSAGAAVWVVGRRPKGEGFNLDPGVRVDTGRWLRVHGPVRVDFGLVWIEATAIEVAEPPAEPAPAPTAAPIPEPPPEVTFSLPLAGEENAARAGPIRIQFSRDMEGSSFKGRVHVAYTEQSPRGESGSDRREVTLASKTSYDAGQRVLNIQLAEPLPPFTTIRVTLSEGITSTTGQPLEPYSLTFTTGR